MPLTLRRRFGRSRIWQELVSRAYVLGLGYLLREKVAYWLFDSLVRVPNYQRAGAIAAIAARRYPQGADVASMRCTLTLRNGDLERGLPILAACLQRGDRRAVDRLLFRTGSRPSDPHQCAAVLDAIAANEHVERTQRCYALIAKAYLTLRHGDGSQAAALRPRLRQLIEELTPLPLSASCPEGNRHNLTKLLVSLQTAGYHLALQAEEPQACEPIWRDVLTLAARIDFGRINADAGLRMTSNLCRCLALGALVDPRRDPGALTTALEAIAGVEQALERNGLSSAPAGRRRPQENHLELMRDLMDACRDLRHPDAGQRSGARERYARLVNHSSNRDLRRVIRTRLDELEALPSPTSSGFEAR